jgi:uncharacterized protein (DUF2141 family)
MHRQSLGIAAAAIGVLVASATVGARMPRQNPAQPRRQAATPQRDVTQSQTPAAGTAEIAGVITLEGSGAPVRRAQVSLSAPEIRGQRTLITDDKGRFDFQNLPSGRYALSASKPGYVTTSYGAKKAGRPGTPIQLADGQKFTQASVLMPKGSVITGTVIDEGNEPTPGTQVRAYRYVMRTGVKTLQQAGSASSDDRGVYRIYGLQPGDYIVSATPRNANLSDIRASVMAQVDQLLQQAQAMNAADTQNGGRGGGGGGRGANAIGGNLGGRGGGGRGQALIDQAAQLQQQLAQQEKEQTVGYAPVYFPGTTNPSSAVPITLGTGEEHGAVDLQLVQLPTAMVTGSIVSPDNHVPQGTQIMLRPVVAPGSPSVPGLAEQGARVLGDGTFAFSGVPPGQYTISARATIREADPTQTAAAQAQAVGRGRGQFGPGGRGGGPISTVLWASTEISVNGQNVTGLSLALTSGMSVSGHVEFRGSTLQAPTDLTRVRVNISSTDTQPQDVTGGLPPATLDANGNFTIPGVPPGHYVLRANAPAGNGGAGPAGGRGGGVAATATTGSWTLKSSTVAGRDSLDFPFEVKPGQDITGAALAFVDHNQTLKGSLQDATGRPTSEYTIIVFATDKSFWTPNSRRITSVRPGTDGSYSIRGLPPGDYRITAVVDVEQGEWFDPDFLAEILPASLPIAITDGGTTTQDLKLAGGI